MKSKSQSPVVEIKKSFNIESARFLPYLPKSHPCAHTHGHSFKITLCLRGPLKDKLDWLVDYNDISKVASTTLKKIDHSLLNKIAGLKNPTTENITIWIYKKLKPKLPELIQVTVSETSDTECSYPVIT